MVSEDHKHHIRPEHAAKIRRWLTQYGGVAHWQEPGGSWSTPLLSENGGPHSKPNPECGDQPSSLTTDIADLLVDLPMEVGCMRLFLRPDANGLTRLDYQSWYALESALARACQLYQRESWCEYDYDRQEAVLYVAERELPLVDWPGAAVSSDGKRLIDGGRIQIALENHPEAGVVSKDKPRPSEERLKRHEIKDALPDSPIYRMDPTTGVVRPLLRNTQSMQSERPDPAAMTRKSHGSDDIREAVFRYQFSDNCKGADPGCDIFFLMVENERDPTDDFMARFRDATVRVKKASQAFWACDPEVVDKVSHEPGVLLRIDGLSWLGDHASVSGGSRAGLDSGSNDDYSLRRDAGKWVVTTVTNSMVW
jgi:hypothetical protein